MTENRQCHFGDKYTKGSKCPFIHTKEGNTPLLNPKPKKKCNNGNDCKYLPNCQYDHSCSGTDQLTTKLEKFTLVTK